MSLNIAYLKKGLRRLVGGPITDFHALAVESWDICPEEEAPGRPALYPPGALDRILGLSPWRDWEGERSLIEGRAGRHGATRAYVLKDAVLAGAYVYSGRGTLRVGHGEQQMFDPDLPQRRRIAEAHMASTWTGADFFGNFIQDSFPLELIPPPGAIRLGARSKTYAHAAGYRTLLDLPEPDRPDHALIGRLTVYSDHAQNSFKEARYRTLRARLRQHLGPSQPSRGVFLRRGSDGERRQLVNEAALVDLLTARGFDIIDLARADAADIARRTLNAPVVIGVEGSHLSHAIYSVADKGAFLVIQPPDRFAMPYKEFTDRMGMTFGFVVALPAEGGFAVDLTDIPLMLDSLL
jgi:Glycosyltransferase 61